MVWFGHIATRGHRKRVILFGVVAATCYFLTLRFVTAAWPSLYSNALKVGGLLGFSVFGLLASQLGNAGLLLVCVALSAPVSNGRKPR